MPLVLIIFIQSLLQRKKIIENIGVYNFIDNILLFEIKLNFSFMPTSSQSQILSVVDYQLLQQHQQQPSGQDGTTTKPLNRISVNQTSVIETKRRSSKDDWRPSTGKKDDYDKQPPTPSNFSARPRNSIKINEGKIFKRKMFSFLPAK